MAHSLYPHHRLIWATALGVLFVGLVASAEVRGRSSRSPFVPPAEMAGSTVAAVTDVTGAFHLWRAAGVHGRRLVVLTGRWSRPMKKPAGAGMTPRDAPRGLTAPDRIDANSALFELARLGVFRRMDVVMPPTAFSHRLGEVKGQKALVREESAFRLHYNGLDRRFSSPDGFEPPAERVLVLVEPSWFGFGAPADPIAWLASRGVASDLIVIAVEDPAATADQRLAASQLARAAGAVFLQPTDR